MTSAPSILAAPLRASIRAQYSRLEWVNQEIKRRTRVALLFPNEATLLRLFTALLAETSEEWESAKFYLNMENHNPPTVRSSNNLQKSFCAAICAVDILRGE